MLRRVSYFILSMLSVMIYMTDSPSMDIDPDSEAIVHTLNRKMNRDESFETVVAHYTVSVSQS